MPAQVSCTRSCRPPEKFYPPICKHKANSYPTNAQPAHLRQMAQHRIKTSALAHQIWAARLEVDTVNERAVNKARLMFTQNLALGIPLSATSSWHTGHRPSLAASYDTTSALGSTAIHYVPTAQDGGKEINTALSCRSSITTLPLSTISCAAGHNRSKWVGTFIEIPI